MNKLVAPTPEDNPLNRFLISRLRSAKVVEHFSKLELEDQISFIYRPTWNGYQPGSLTRAALSYLYSPVPIQVVLDTVALNDLLLGVSGPELSPIRKRPVGLTRQRAEQMFPYKPQRQSLTKANVYFNECQRDLWRLDPNFCYEANPYIELLAKEGVTNDAATAFLMYAYALRPHCNAALVWSCTAILSPKLAKQVSVFLKAVGGNATRLGARLVEGESLSGRGVGDLDLKDEARKRCDPAYIRENMLAEFDEQLLRRAVRRVLEEEIIPDPVLGRAVEFPKLEDHWTSRWSWAVNGSNSGILDRVLRPGHEKHPDIERYHRRAWLEELEHDPRIGWDGTTYVSASPKLEHGKTRAIFACDTVNYLAFEHLLGAVEKRWRGRRVILNPGRGGHLGMCERVRRARDRSGISLMLDYDDFNSHHSTKSMQVVIDELATYTQYDPSLARTLISSLDKHRVYCGSEFIGTAAGTLMSGHRGTTFFNSVLNRAYLVLVLGDEFMERCPALHVGDDVYLGVRNYSEAAFVARNVFASRLRMNRSKQSIGHISTEFLRVATSGRESYGYLTRSIAAAVSGNWVNERILDPADALTSIIGTARTMANRADNQQVPLLLVTALSRLIGPDSLDDSSTRDLLLGRLAINNGPQYVSGGTYRYLTISNVFEEEPLTGVTPLVLNATKSYLAKHSSPLEIQVLAENGLSVEKEMEKSSYSKSLRYSKSISSVSITGPHTSRAVGSARAEDLLHVKKSRGVLAQYPLLVLVKNRLSDDSLRRAVKLAGGNPNASDITLEAWGEYKHGCIINAVLSYSDASSLGKRTRASVLTATRRCFI
ncbi:RNA-dependent RNA polymerase [Colletotrichum caudatum totivirus 1]|nr:RNA-dependent RNA polymerase [Colletotrichum caudatum totivirus 1]